MAKTPGARPRDDARSAIPGYAKSDFSCEPDPRYRARRCAVLQSDERDCGLAALGTICKSYGASLSNSDLRQLLDVGPDGLSLFELASAAGHLGLETLAVEADLDALRQCHLPAICRCGDHYVVLFHVSRTSAVLADPQAGLLKRPLRDFAEDWDGVALLLKPTSAFKRSSADSLRELRSLEPLLRANVRVLLGVFLVSAGLGAVGIYVPILSGRILDAFLKGVDHRLRALVVALVALRGGIVLTHAIRSMVVRWLESRIDRQLMVALTQKVFTLPLKTFRSRQLGDYSSRFHQVFRTGTLVNATLVGGALDVVGGVIFFCVLLALFPRVAFVGLGAATIMVASSWMCGVVLKVKLRELSLLHSELFGRFIGNLRNLVTLRLACVDGAVAGTLATTLDRVNRKRATLGYVESSMGCLQEAASLVVSAEVLCLFSAWLGLGGNSLGSMIAAAGLLMQFLAPVGRLGESWLEIQEMLVTVGRVGEVLEAESEGSTLSTGASSKRGNVLVLEKVSFRYSAGRAPVLEDVSLDLQPGAVLAVVGASGAGKSTLLQLIPRLYEASEGSVAVHGMDVMAWDPWALRSQIGFVSQEAAIVAGSILDNVTLGTSTTVDERRLREATMRAGLYDYVLDLPAQFRTRLGEDDGPLSVGQKQRLTIARALYKAASILVLDEATSALDAETEVKIMNSIVESRRWTIVLASHRLSVVRLATEVAVLQGGRLVERGTPTELIQRRGDFYRLFASQIGGYQGQPRSARGANGTRLTGRHSSDVAGMSGTVRC